MSSPLLPPQINPKTLAARVQNERKARGQTQRELADLLGVARTTLVAVEKGERLLSAPEIARLSAIWEVPVSDLVRERPVVEPLAPQLRAAAPGGTLKPDEVEGLWQSAEKLRVLGENYLELENLTGRPLASLYPPLYSTAAMPPREAAADVALRERHRLGLGDGPIPHLRAVLENEVGLRIFLLSMPSRLAGMFAFDAQLGGCVALNVAHPAERRLWTLAHEFWHFLCERYQADVCPLPGAAPRRQSESEKMADAFAAHFLMPDSGLRRRFYDLKAAKPDGVTPGDLLHLKRQYGVSFSALTRRLEELKLLREGTLQSLQDAGFRVGEVEALAGLPPQTEREERLPERYRILAVESYLNAELSEGQLRRFLDCDIVEARRIVEDLSNEIEVTEQGERGTLEIPLDQVLEAA